MPERKLNLAEQKKKKKQKKASDCRRVVFIHACRHANSRSSFLKTNLNTKNGSIFCFRISILLRWCNSAIDTKKKWNKRKKLPTQLHAARTTIRGYFFSLAILCVRRAIKLYASKDDTFALLVVCGMNGERNDVAVDTEAIILYCFSANW